MFSLYCYTSFRVFLSREIENFDASNVAQHFFRSFSNLFFGKMLISCENSCRENCAKIMTMMMIQEKASSADKTSKLHEMFRELAIFGMCIYCIVIFKLELLTQPRN